MACSRRASSVAHSYSGGGREGAREDRRKCLRSLRGAASSKESRVIRLALLRLAISRVLLALIAPALTEAIQSATEDAIRHALEQARTRGDRAVAEGHALPFATHRRPLRIQ